MCANEREKRRHAEKPRARNGFLRATRETEVDKRRGERAAAPPAYAVINYETFGRATLDEEAEKEQKEEEEKRVGGRLWRVGERL